VRQQSLAHLELDGLRKVWVSFEIIDTTIKWNVFGSLLKYIIIYNI